MLFPFLKSFVHLFTIINHDNANLFRWVIYFENQSVISNSKLISVQAYEFLDAKSSWIVFEFSQVFDDAFVSFRG